MDLLSLIFTGIGLAMDASAVSIAKGMSLPNEKNKNYALKLGLAFGIFQGLMPLIGYLAGSTFSGYIQSVDHWVAFILLALIGLNMIKESREEKENEEVSDLSLKVILLLAIATSIDALAVGVSFAFLKVNIMLACSIIAIVTFILSFICVMVGKRLGSLFQKYAEIFGGIILMMIGAKILIEHLFL
ncbi:Predicted membrane protein [Faecalitalea cylindroides T2-87]|uniref:Putative manganese efflux pump MntP n=1 Tax=Faecalitalea cylindroides T2-87 TaxID=717960 RepID=D4JFY2_9FIRM|nr:Predicted membrane protein [Faecalitalea cylindroides T2-87]